jgi:ketosteroid isomerase-like protein
MTNADLITSFYDAFSRADAEGMIACYDANIVFSDPAFGELHGEEAAGMWRMLLARSKGELTITYGDVSAGELIGSANWTAEYRFGQTGRPVLNRISAEFEFKNGKIIRHSDHFDMWKWSRQALGMPGYLLGWSGFLKGKIRKQVRGLLRTFMERQ